MRIASLSPAVTEILCALGLQDQIVCTDQFSNFPEAAKEIPHLKDHQRIAIEELKPHKPDLVFTSTVIQEKLAEQLHATDISCVHLDPRTINTLYENIRQIGTLLDCDASAEELVLQMQQGFNDTKKKAGLLPARPRIYIEEWPAVMNTLSGRHDPPMASGNWVPEIVRIAGGEQFPIPAGELSRKVELSEVEAFDPALIVISWCGAGLLADPSILTEREGWGALRAVSEGHIRVIDDSLLNRPGPRLVEGAQRLYSWFFEMLH